MLVDRTELESQLFKSCARLWHRLRPDRLFKTRAEKILSSDYRGLVVSMIHKFEDIPADMSTRNNVIVLVDEAHHHRRRPGQLPLAALPNATYIRLYRHAHRPALQRAKAHSRSSE